MSDEPIVPTTEDLLLHEGHVIEIMEYVGSVIVACDTCQALLVEVWKKDRPGRMGTPPARRPGHFVAAETKLPVTLPLGPLCKACLDPIDEPHVECDLALASDEHAGDVHSYEESVQAFGRAVRASGWRIG